MRPPDTSCTPTTIRFLVEPLAAEEHKRRTFASPRQFSVHTSQQQQCGPGGRPLLVTGDAVKVAFARQ